MVNTIDTSNIVIPEAPIEANYGEWLMEHPDCDSIIEHIGTGPTVLIYAYACNKGGNRELEAYRDDIMPGRRILMGISEDAINSVL